ncbi:MAG: hypothetical protein ABW034_03135 [Steroidobacteraceae bacterium]
MANEPGAAVLTIFDQLIDRIKQRSPVRADGKPLGSMVYSQLVLGMPIWREDYLRPWTPAGGASLQESFPAPPAGDTTAGGSTTPATQPDPRMLRAMQAAWKTALLGRTMLEVTTDGLYREYPTGRHLDFAYETILKGMQPGAMPEMAPDVKNRLEEAQRVLFELDTDGTIIGKSRLYKNYLNNAMMLAKAKSDFAAANAAAMTDPVKANAWPVQSGTFQQMVDQAQDALVTEGGPKVERAIDTIASVGVPMQAHMIKKAKDAFDAWNLGLSGIVPAKMPYSMILPTNWCDPDDHDGWETLIVDQSSYQHYASSSARSQSQQSWERHASSVGGSGGVVLGFAAFGGSAGSSSQSSSWQSSSESHFQSAFNNTAKNLHIELEYGLCTIVRPWLISDLFFLKNWYLVGAKKQSVSDGTIDGQANSQDKTLPMIPQQFLVVRNVTISSSDWGSDGQVLSDFYGGGQGSTSSSSSSQAGSGGVSLGFISFGGSASHSRSDASGQSSGWSARSGSEHFGTTFDGQTLKIPGAQIVAFLSDIVPANPELDDPTLPQ